MVFKEIEKKYKQLYRFIHERRLLDALNELKSLMAESGNDYFQVQLEKHLETYQNILRYSFTGVDDPEREKIYTRLLSKVSELADRVKQAVLTDKSGLKTYKMKWSLEQESRREKDHSLKGGHDVIFDAELREFMGHAGKVHESGDDQAMPVELQDKVFRMIWLCDTLSEKEQGLLTEVAKAEYVPWYLKSFLVSAVTLSLLRCFDVRKVSVLFDFFNQQEEEIWQRALAGLIIGLYIHDSRLAMYPGIIHRLKMMEDDAETRKNVEAIIIQFIRSKDTKRITQQWEEEILPEMLKMAPKIREKLDLENIVKNPFFEEKNPEWEKFFEDTPNLMDKLQEFSQLQMEGGDVFMSAFSRLKHFPFFNHMGNWFMPFYKQNQEVAGVFDGESATVKPGSFVDALATSHFMCNSDKYSFILNLKHIPEAQKEQMMGMFDSEIKGMEEISKEDKLLDGFKKTQAIYTQYFQDLYRFFKLHPLKGEFTDIFEMPLDLKGKRLFNILIGNKKALRNIAEFYFSKNYFEEALDIYLELVRQGDEGAELYEKTGYCYQMLKDYRNALAYYKKAELFDKNKGWVLKKISLCYRYLNDHENALEYYRQAEQIEPDSLYIQTYMGHSYLERKDYDNALKHYFKVEYLAPENDKIQRPIAWCSFMNDKYGQAEKYYQKLLEKASHFYDLINLGHVYWCTGHLAKAVSTYKKALIVSDKDTDLFHAAFQEDKEILVSKGVPAFEIPLMIDHVRQKE